MREKEPFDTNMHNVLYGRAPWVNGITEWPDSADMLFQVLTGKTFTEDGKTYSTDITGDYDIAQPRQGRYLNFQSANSNSVTTKMKPAYIVDGKSLICVFKRKKILVAYERYFSCATTASSDYFQLRQQQTLDRTVMVYSDLSSVYWENSEFVTAGCEEDWCRFEIVAINSDTQFEISMYNHSTNVQVGSTKTATIGDLPDQYISLCCKDYDGIITEWHDMQVAYFKGNGKEYYFNQETGAYIVGDDGSILTIAGTIDEDTHQIDNALENPNNNEGFYEVATTGIFSNWNSLLGVEYEVGTIIRQDPDNSTKAFAWYSYGPQQDLTRIGQCGFCPEITETTVSFPNCPEVYKLDQDLGGDELYETPIVFDGMVENINNLDLVFTDVAGEPINMIGFEIPRTPLTNPTLIEVGAYLSIDMSTGDVLPPEDDEEIIVPPK